MRVLDGEDVGQSQFSAYVKYLEVRSRPEIKEVQAWILGHPAEDLSVSVYEPGWPRGRNSVPLSEPSN